LRIGLILEDLDSFAADVATRHLGGLPPGYTVVTAAIDKLALTTAGGGGGGEHSQQHGGGAGVAGEQQQQQQQQQHGALQGGGSRAQQTQHLLRGQHELPKGWGQRGGAASGAHDAAAAAAAAAAPAAAAPAPAATAAAAAEQAQDTAQQQQQQQQQQGRQPSGHGQAQGQLRRSADALALDLTQYPLSLFQDLKMAGHVRAKRLGWRWLTGAALAQAVHASPRGCFALWQPAAQGGVWL
jgi:hypothetical protein